ncbi:class II aldolase/adducin family protein [Nocardioides ultimimeridianus]
MRAAVVQACHRLAAAGLLIGTAGNVSVRDGGTVWVTASGAVLAELTEDDVVEATDPRATSEAALHLGIHETYDAGAVVHTHAPVSTAASTVLTELPVIHYQQLLLGGAIRVAPYATFGTPELAEHVRTALEGRSAALMANHGSVALGATLEQAVENALLLEWLCTVHRDALAFGTPRTLTAQQQEDVVLAAIARSYGESR